MLFNSHVFLIFFAVVYPVYLLLGRRHQRQNAWLLAASYVFYGWWDWRFLSLLAGSTVVDFCIGRRLAATADETNRRRLLLSSVVVNLGVLGFFKYFNFFADSVADVVRAFGMSAYQPAIDVLLPVGISFYTFQTLSYTIDVYRRQTEPVDNLIDFGLYVAFFPQLVAGPIERSGRLLSQITTPRHITASGLQSGLFLVLWGFYKKVVIADNLAPLADETFTNPETGLLPIAGILAFAIQIYGDFSGYSDIARGLGRLMGFDLMLNFRLPYFAISPSDFWQRWHISLSSWLRDYLYIPLGGNRGSGAKTSRNLLITMLLGGLWHGAAWHFVAWGAYHGLLLGAYRATGLARIQHSWASAKDIVRTLSMMAVMFVFTLGGWVLFRAASVSQAIDILSHIRPEMSSGMKEAVRDLVFYSAPLLVVQLVQYRTRDLLVLLRLPLVLRAVMFVALLMAVVMLAGGRQEFIYFQF